MLKSRGCGYTNVSNCSLSLDISVRSTKDFKFYQWSVLIREGYSLQCKENRKPLEKAHNRRAFNLYSNQS